MKRTEIWIAGILVTTMIGVLAFWSLVAYVIHHFIVKYW